MVQPGGVNVGLDEAFGVAAIQQATPKFDRTARFPGQFGQLPHLLAVLKVFLQQQFDEIGAFDVHVKGAIDRDPQGFQDRLRVEFVAVSHRVVAAKGMHQCGAIELFLALEIVIDHPLGGPCRFGDHIDARALQASCRKLDQGCIKDIVANLIGLGIFRTFSLWSGQILGPFLHVCACSGFVIGRAC